MIPNSILEYVLAWYMTPSPKMPFLPLILVLLVLSVRVFFFTFLKGVENKALCDSFGLEKMIFISLFYCVTALHLFPAHWWEADIKDNTILLLLRKAFLLLDGILCYYTVVAILKSSHVFDAFLLMVAALFVIVGLDNIVSSLFKQWHILQRLQTKCYKRIDFTKMDAFYASFLLAFIVLMSVVLLFKCNNTS